MEQIFCIVALNDQALKDSKLEWDLYYQCYHPISVISPAVASPGTLPCKLRAIYNYCDHFVLY